MKIISVRSAAIALTFCLCTFVAAAQTKPNLTGTWKMNESKGKFAHNIPSEITIKFDQKDSSFTELLTVIENGEHKMDLKYTADGKETTNQFENQPVQTTASWEGETLVIEVKIEQGKRFIRKITISSDGKTMTMTVHHAKGENASDTVVLEKQ